MQQSAGHLISLPGHQMANLSQFYVYPTQNIIRFHPLAGFSHAGTVIFINGTWSLGSVSLDSYSPMRKFGSQIVKDIFAESRLISCRAPSTFGVGPPVVELSITLNEVGFISSPTTFNYYNAVYINTISPNMICLVYVDDTILASPDSEAIERELTGLGVSTISTQR